MIGIEKSLEVIADVESLALGSIDVAYAGMDLVKGFSFLKLGVVIGLVSELKTLVDSAKELKSDAIAALPELKDLDPSESSKLAERSHQAILNIAKKVVQK